MKSMLPDFDVIEESESGDGCALLRFEFTLSASTVYLQGHFPEAPILPGVAQLDWAIQLAAEYWGTSTSVQTVEVLKFKEMILPEMQVTVSLERKRENCILFRYSSGEQSFSSGRLVYKKRDAQ